MENEESEVDVDQLISDLLENKPVGVSVIDDEYDDDMPGTLQIPESPTALVLDRWSLRIGEEILEDNPGIKDILAKEPGKKVKPKEYDDMILKAADFHAAAFEPVPELAENPTDKKIALYMEQLMSTPEFQQLHHETCLDPVASEMACAHFAKGWKVVVETDPGEGDGGDGDGDGGFKEGLRNLKAASDALKDADAEVNEWRDMEKMFGMGGGGSIASKMPKDVIQKWFQKIKDNEQLRKILEFAGSFRRLAQAKQRQKMIHGMDEISGIEMGNKIPRLLTSEKARLADEDLEWLMLKKIVDRMARMKKLRSIEDEIRGAIVCIVDESGSMNGHAIAQAKAMALALYWVAQHQKRWCCLIGFSGATEGNFLVLPPEEPKQDELLEWLAHFYGGGTDMDVPLNELPAKWDSLGTPKGRTDIIQITDCCCHVPEATAKSFNKFKEEREVKMTTIVIGGDEAGPLEAVSDRTYSCADLSLDNDAVGESLSI